MGFQGYIELLQAEKTTPPKHVFNHWVTPNMLNHDFNHRKKFGFENCPTYPQNVIGRDRISHNIVQVGN